MKTRRMPRKGFTLVEVLVVIAIIVLLIAILVPSFAYARQRARASATASLINNISVGLEAYRAELGTYPRFYYIGFSSGDGGYWNGVCFYEHAILARALTGYQPQGNGTVGSGDGAEGPGFRARPGGEGTVYGPYLRPKAGNFRTFATQADMINPNIAPVSGTLLSNSNANFGREWHVSNVAFVDAWSQPIFYWSATARTAAGNNTTRRLFGYTPDNQDSIFRSVNPDYARPAALSYTEPDSGLAIGTRLLPYTPAGAWRGTGTSASPLGAQLAHQSDTTEYSTANPRPGLKFRAMLGMSNPASAYAKASDRIVGRDSFLLVSAGPDNVYFTGDEILNEGAR